MVETETVIFL